MIGRAPIMMQPQFAQPQFAQPQFAQPQFGQPPMQAYPGPQPAPRPVAQQQWQPPNVQPAPPQPQFRPVPMTAQQTVQPILARGKPYDEPAPVMPRQPVPAPVVSLSPVSLPSPEALGLARTTKVDWNDVHESLERLGGVGVQSVPLPDGRHRVALMLRTAQVDQVHHVEAIAATEAEALTAALARAQEWRTSGR